GLSTLVHWHCRRKWISARSRPCPNRPGSASSTHRDGDWPFRDKGRKASDGEGILEPYRRDGEMPRGRGTRRGDPRGAIPRQTGSRTADAAKAQSRTGRITGPVLRLGEAFGPDRTARSPGRETGLGTAGRRGPVFGPGSAPDGTGAGASAGRREAAGPTRFAR